MKNHKWDLLAASLALLVMAGYLWVSGEWRPPGTNTGHRLTRSLLVVPEAIPGLMADATHTLGAISQIFVLVHNGDEPLKAPDWSALAKCGKPVILTFHYPPSLAAEIEARLPAVAWKIGAEMTGTCVQAKNQGVDVQGIYLDYDAPLNAVSEYETFLQRMGWRVPAEFPVSIGVHPEWLDSPQFFNLTGGIRSFVLIVQEDAFSRETGPVESGPARLRDWVRQAERRGRPYQIEFRVPTTSTHGSADTVTPRENSATAESPKSPVALLAQQVHALEDAQLLNLRGVIWNSVPAGPDIPAWSVDAFAALLSGRKSTGKVKATAPPSR